MWWLSKMDKSVRLFETIFFNEYLCFYFGEFCICVLYK